jgi:hypothetical protein
MANSLITFGDTVVAEEIPMAEPKNKAKRKTPAKGKGAWQAEHFPTSAYRDGPDNTIEVLDSDDGAIPSSDWVDTPAKCKNTGDHVKVKL